MDSGSTESQGKTVLDCTQFQGRKRAICEGTSGLCPEDEEKYRQLWAGQQNPRGLGDTVKGWIDRWVPRWLIRWLMPTGDCGCKKRQELLNKLVPYGTETGEKLD